MNKETESIKAFGNISKTGILKARVKYGSWKNVARHFNIRKVTIRTIAKSFGIDTAKIIKPKLKVIPKIRKPEKGFNSLARLPYMGLGKSDRK